MVPNIVVVIVGGVVADVLNIPEGYNVEIRDYDVEGVEAEKLEKDAHGNEYTCEIIEGGE